MLYKAQNSAWMAHELRRRWVFEDPIAKTDISKRKGFFIELY